MYGRLFVGAVLDEERRHMESPSDWMFPREIKVSYEGSAGHARILRMEARFSNGTYWVRVPFDSNYDCVGRCLEHLCVCSTLRHENDSGLVAVNDLYTKEGDSGWSELRTLT